MIGRAVTGGKDARGGKGVSPVGESVGEKQTDRRAQDAEMGGERGAEQKVVGVDEEGAQDDESESPRPRENYGYGEELGGAGIDRDRHEHSLAGAEAGGGGHRPAEQADRDTARHERQAIAAALPEVAAGQAAHWPGAARAKSQRSSTSFSRQVLFSCVSPGVKP